MSTQMACSKRQCLRHSPTLTSCTQASSEACTTALKAPVGTQINVEGKSGEYDGAGQVHLSRSLVLDTPDTGIGMNGSSNSVIACAQAPLFQVGRQSSWTPLPLYLPASGTQPGGSTVFIDRRGQTSPPLLQERDFSLNQSQEYDPVFNSLSQSQKTPPKLERYQGPFKAELGQLKGTSELQQANKSPPSPIGVFSPQTGKLDTCLSLQIEPLDIPEMKIASPFKRFNCQATMTYGNWLSQFAPSDDLQSADLQYCKPLFKPTEDQHKQRETTRDDANNDTPSKTRALQPLLLNPLEASDRNIVLCREADRADKGHSPAPMDEGDQMQSRSSLEPGTDEAVGPEHVARNRKRLLHEWADYYHYDQDNIEAYNPVIVQMPLGPYVQPDITSFEADVYPGAKNTRSASPEPIMIDYPPIYEEVRSPCKLVNARLNFRM